MKIPYRFDPDTEAKYLEMKFQESRTFAIMVGQKGTKRGQKGDRFIF